MDVRGSVIVVLTIVLAGVLLFLTLKQTPGSIPQNALRSAPLSCSPTRECPLPRRLTLKEGPPQWQSQLQQDQTVYMLLGGKNNGYFVDLAANEPMWISNSYALEQWFGWAGVCIEPTSKLVAKLIQQRTCHTVQTVVDSQPGTVLFTFANASAISTLVAEDTDYRVRKEAFRKERTESIPSRTLESILDQVCAPSTMDYLSLDVEGSEWRALQNFPFHRYRFRIMTIERANRELCVLLHLHGYRLAGFLVSKGESIWLHGDFVGNTSRQALPAALAKLRNMRFVPKTRNGDRVADAPIPRPPPLFMPHSLATPGLYKGLPWNEVFQVCQSFTYVYV